MGFGRMEYYSNCLRRNISFMVVYPDDVIAQEGSDSGLLVLLHGFQGSCSDWILNSHIAEMAIKYHLFAILPNGENSFYLDREETGRKYATLIGEELPKYVRGLFHISKRREDTWIGGFSMGGFQFPDTYEKAFALSSALIMNEVKQMEPGYQTDFANYEYYRGVFGNIEQYEHSIDNPQELIRRSIESGTRIPPIFMACGTEDFMIKENREFAEFMKSYKAPVTYVEDQGVHDFNFWDKYLEPSIQWLIRE